MATAAAIKRSIRWQRRQAVNGNCLICASPVARACQTPNCKKYRQHTLHKNCTACLEPTKALKKCKEHLKQDADRIAERRAIS